MVKLKRIIPKFLRKKNKKEDDGKTKSQSKDSELSDSKSKLGIKDEAIEQSNVPETLSKTETSSKNHPQSNEVLTDEAIDKSEKQNVESIENSVKGVEGTKEQKTVKTVSEILEEKNFNEKTREVKGTEEVKNNTKQDTINKNEFIQDKESTSFSKNIKVTNTEGAALKTVKNKKNKSESNNSDKLRVPVVSNIVSDDEKVNDGSKQSKIKDDCKEDKDRKKQFKPKIILADKEAPVDDKTPSVRVEKVETQDNDQEKGAIPDFVEADHVPPVAASKQWLVDFEKKNKEHARKGTKRSIDASSIGSSDNKIESGKKLEPALFGIFKNDKESNDEKKEDAKKLDSTKFDMFKPEDRSVKKESTKKLDSSMFAMFKSVDEKAGTPKPKKLRTDKFQMFTSPKETHLKMKSKEDSSAEVVSENIGEKENEKEDDEKNEAKVEHNAEEIEVTNKNNSESSQQEVNHKKNTIEKKDDNNIDNPEEEKENKTDAREKAIVKPDLQQIDEAKDDDGSIVDNKNIAQTKNEISKEDNDTNELIHEVDDASKTNENDSELKKIEKDENTKNDSIIKADDKDNESNSPKSEEDHCLKIDEQETETFNVDNEKTKVDEKTPSMEDISLSESKTVEGSKVVISIDGEKIDSDGNGAEKIEEANLEKIEAEDDVEDDAEDSLNDK